MTGLISWNGQRSDQFGIMVEKFPDYSRPRRKFDSYTIPGRNGDLIMMQDAWENVEQRYSIAAGSGEQKGVFPGNAVKDYAPFVHQQHFDRGCAQVDTDVQFFVH